MPIDAKFIDQCHLIRPHSEQESGENGILFTLEAYLLSKDEDLRKSLIFAIYFCRESKGIYKQTPMPMGGDERYMSHDQLTAFTVLSLLENLNVHSELWEEIKRQGLRYNNVDVTNNIKNWLQNNRFLHPRDILYYGYCNGSIICTLLLPLLFIILLENLRKKYKIINGEKVLETDGKLLNFIRVAPFKNSRLSWKIYSKIQDFIIKKLYGGWHNIFKIYFKEEDHPCNIYSKGL